MNKCLSRLLVHAAIAFVMATLLACAGAPVGTKSQPTGSNRQGSQQGIMVVQVKSGSAAQRAGLQTGDIIKSMDGVNVSAANELARMLRKAPAGKHVLLVERKGVSRYCVVQLPEQGTRQRLGVYIQTLGPPATTSLPRRTRADIRNANTYASRRTRAMQRDRRRPEQKAGLLVTAVQAGSAAERAGLLPGDVIISFDRKKPSSPSEFVTMVQSARRGRHLVVLKRNGKVRRAVVSLPPPGTRPRLGISLTAIASAPKPRPGSSQVAANDALRLATRKVAFTPSASLSARLQEINVLKYAFVDPTTGCITFIGTYEPSYASGPIAYRDLLADALQDPYPEFSLDLPSGRASSRKVIQFMDREIRRITQDDNYGKKWMNKTLLAVIHSQEPIPEKRVLETRMKRDLGIEPAEFKAYLQFDPRQNPIDPAQYRLMENFLGKLFKAIGIEERFGNAVFVFHKMQNEWRLGKPDPNTTWELGALLGVTNQLYQIQQDLAANRLSDEAAGRQLWAELYGALLKGLGVDPRKVNALTDRYRKGIGWDEQLSDELDKRYTFLAQEALSRHVFNCLIFSQDFLQHLYPDLPVVSSGVVLYGRRPDSPLASVMFRADYALKYLTSLSPEAMTVPGHSSVLQFLTAEAEKRNTTVPAHGLQRFWIKPAQVKMDALTDGSGVRFSSASLRIGAEPLQETAGSAFLQQALDRYAERLTRHYDDYAALYPSLHVMREAAKIIAFARWLKQKRLPVNLPAYEPVKNPVPQRVKGFVSLVYVRKEKGALDNLFLDVSGGVNFSESAGDAWMQVDPNSKATRDVMRQMAASTALAEQATAAALAGDLEGARELAEKSARAMTGLIDSTRLPQIPGVPLPTPAHSTVTAGTQAAVSQAALEALERNLDMKAKASRSIAETKPLQKTSPAQYREITASAQQQLKRSEGNLRHLKTLLAKYRANPVHAPKLVIDLQALDPVASATMAVVHPPALAASRQQTLSLDEALPTREDYLAELNALRRELDMTRVVLRRLTEAVQADARLRQQWEQEAQAAVNRAQDRACNFIKDSLSEKLFNFLKWSNRNSQERVRELEQLEHLITTKEFSDWAQVDRHSWEDIAQQLVSVAKSSALGPQAQALVSAVQHAIGSAYDITAWFASWRTIQQLDSNTENYLLAVDKLSRRMRKIVERIKEIKDHLRSG